MRMWYAAIVAVAGLALSGCFSSSNSDDDAVQPPPPPAAPPAATAFRPFFVPAGGIVPYPNDLFFNGSTDGTLNLPLLSTLPNAATVNALDGYSTTAVIRATFSGESASCASMVDRGTPPSSCPIQNARPPGSGSRPSTLPYTASTNPGAVVDSYRARPSVPARNASAIPSRVAPVATCPIQ